ncbi:Guanylate cyclase [Aphelenchoides bicaudatus]|nr:Guanylate cyclase [Aphelenchoides bicaudatus]
MFRLFLYLNCLWAFADSQATHINLGILIPNGVSDSIDKQVGFSFSAGAIVSGLNRAIQLGIYDPSVINITFSWHFDQCDESLSGGYAAKLIYDEKVSAIFGPVCPQSSYVVGALANFKQIPVFLWGTVAPQQFYDRVLYPTTFPFAGTVRGMFSSLSYILTNFNWTSVAFVYTTTDDLSSISTCGYFAETFETQSLISNNISETYTRHAVNATVGGFQTILRSVNLRARIIISCLETKTEKRNYMIAAMNNNMNMCTLWFSQHLLDLELIRRFGLGNNEDGLDDEVKEASKSVLIMDKFLNTTEISSDIRTQMQRNIVEWPFYCSDCAKNSSAMVHHSCGILLQLWRTCKDQKTCHPIIGNTFIMSNGIRAARYMLIGLNAAGESTTYAMINSNSGDGIVGYNPSYTDASTSIWATRNGFVPTTFPKCGLNNELCPPSPIFYTVIVIGCIVIFLLVVGTLAVSIYYFRHQQRKRLNALWQIPHLYLIKPEEKDQSKSVRSFNSNHTDSSRSTFLRKDTQHTEFKYYNHALVVCRKHQHSGTSWRAEEEEQFRKMRATDHANLNRFLGMSVSGSICYSIWASCDRGNVIEVIKAHSFRIDGFIMTGMIRNIVEGLHYIHNSRFVQHGILSAYRCMVGDRFEFYGLKGLKEKTFRRLDEHSALYVAPEHLHGQQTEVGTQEGDIYSLGITCSVILTMKPAYGLEEEEDESEIVRAVAKGKYPPVRPSLNIDPSIEINPELVTLVRKMWSEHPTERPKIGDIREIILKRISTSRSTNLMDYMFALMENNAAELEQDVQQRTMELLEEQKKADILLYRMMPREAADLLKLGQTVTPEVFESSTVFFSDIVSFTVLASKSTPLQIINFLNETYTLADGVIDKYDVYKVETIGDGMHVVSGVPKRNGTAHVKAICDMSIDFQRAVKTLRMSHLPDQVIQMRVGVHSGPAVAGIVGVTSPRYIVFGDTVNLAAKMEASGRAGRIHISTSTKALILAHYPKAYTVFDRGETLIKGAGAMHSHWLVAPEEVSTFQA